MGAEYIVIAVQHIVQAMDCPSNVMAMVRKQLEPASGDTDDIVDPVEQASVAVEWRRGEWVRIARAIEASRRPRKSSGSATEERSESAEHACGRLVEPSGRAEWTCGSRESRSGPLASTSGPLEWTSRPLKSKREL
jgi:hypothetical protein